VLIKSLFDHFSECFTLLYLWKRSRFFFILSRMRFKTIAAAMVLGGVPAGALAVPFSTFNQIVAFGDSLSDAGNAAIATAGVYPGANYATRSVPGVPFPVGYFTDGTSTTPATSGPTGLWVDQLAAKIGVTDPIPALAPAGGTNYAVGGALTGSTNTQDMQNQVSLFLAQNAALASPSALYAFWGGANDIIAGNNPVQAADNIDAEIKQVSAAGGKYFLWPDLPALGATPEGAALGTTDATLLNAATAAFNSEWSKDVASLDQSGITVVGVDVFSLVNSIIADKQSYGFSDVTDPAQGLTGVNPNTYLFWDGLHPTTEADSYVASLAAADLSAVPEPGCAMIAVGAIALLGRRSRNRRASDV
jgi:phospholipase/lecithinase/hemolysin